MDMTPQQAEKKRRQGYLELMRASERHPLHGTTTGYGYGCRCERCKAANKEMRERRKAERGMAFAYNFPAHLDVPEAGDVAAMQMQVGKVLEEAREVDAAFWDHEGDDRVIEEALDTVCACETLLRAFPVERVKAARDAVVAKNAKRGYWGER